MLQIALSLLLAPPTSYDEAQTALEQALDDISAEDISPSDLATALEQGIAAVEGCPSEVASDADVLDKLARARLALAWVHILEGTEQGEAAAIAAIDEAIRSARGIALPAASFGVKIKALHDERLRVLKSRGTAILEVECGPTPCRVIIDERRSANPSDPLLLGSYRVWISAQDGEVWELHRVELDAPDLIVKLVYEAGQTTKASQADLSAEAFPPTPQPANPAPVDPPVVSKPKRIMPVWAATIGLVLGAGAAIAGGLILSNNLKCPRSETEPDFGPDTCPNVHDPATELPGAYALLGVGGAALVSFGAVLTVDRVRMGKANANQVMLTWVMRF